MSDSEPRAYAEAYALWNAIERCDDVKAASISRIDPAKLIEIPSATRTALVVRAAEHGLYETVKIALESGLHPDDARIFQTPLLGLYPWYSNPKHTALALKHGASPNVMVTKSVLAEDKVPLARYLALRLYINGAYIGEAISTMTVETLTLILLAGATASNIDFGEGPMVTDSYPSASWLIASSATKLPEQEKLLASLIPLFKAAGSDIDTPCGFRNTRAAAPIIAAVRNKNRSAVEAFIAAGARVDDQHLVHAATSVKRSSKTLFEEVDEAFGTGESAWARQAIMRKVIADSEVRNGPPATGPISGILLRRMPGV